MVATCSVSGPSVSVLMPIYNGERYVDSAVKSVLQQTYSDFELIAVDDGSTDSSRSRLDRIAADDPRLRVISRPNTGIVGALNDALAVARGHFIARMDSDDISLPSRFAAQVRYLDEHPDVVLVGSRVLLIDPEGLPIGDMATVACDSAVVERSLLEGGWPIVHPSVMMRGEILRLVGGYRQGTFPFEDHDLFLRLLDHGRIANLAEPLVLYRRHDDSIVASLKDKRSILLDVIDAARSRRGLDPLERPSQQPRHARRSERRDWIWLALRSGHAPTARKYSLRVLRERPFQKESWRALYCAFRGR